MQKWMKKEVSGSDNPDINLSNVQRKDNGGLQSKNAMHTKQIWFINCAIKFFGVKLTTLLVTELVFLCEIDQTVQQWKVVNSDRIQFSLKALQIQFTPLFVLMNVFFFFNSNKTSKTPFPI